MKTSEAAVARAASPMRCAGSEQLLGVLPRPSLAVQKELLHQIYSSNDIK